MSDYKKIILKNSPTAGAVPLEQFLDHGELALNYADRKIYYKDLDGNIVVYETPNIDVNASPNSVVRRNLDGSGIFNGVISEGTEPDIYGIYSTHSSAATAKLINTGVCTGAEISADAGFGAEISSLVNTGAKIYSTSGDGAEIYSSSGTGARIYSLTSGIGAEIRSQTNSGAEIRSISGTGAEISSETGLGLLITSAYGSGAQISLGGSSPDTIGLEINTASGVGLSVDSLNSTGISCRSINDTAAEFYTENGDYHARFGSSTTDVQGLGISAPNASVDWLKFSGGAVTATGKLQTTITANRTWTLPDASGTILLDSDITDGGFNLNTENFTGDLSGEVTGKQNTTVVSTTAVTGKVLTGYSSATGAITAADTILTAIGKLNGNIALKADLASPTFTGTVSGITKAMVGLTNVDDTSDANKPVSTAQQTALNLKANIASPTFTGTVSGITATMVGLANVDNTSDANKPVSTAQQTALNLKANIASPTFTGTVSGISKAMVGLGNVNDTSDASKPVSTAQQTALNLKADLASPTFTGTVTLPAGTASIAPVKLTSGTNLTAPVLGAIEFDGNNLYFTTNATTPTRNTIAFTSPGVPAGNGKIITVNATTGTDDRTGLEPYSAAPFASIGAATAASANGDLIYVRTGTYTITTGTAVNLDGKGDVYFEPGTTVNVNSGTAFVCSVNEKKKVCGYADFVVNATASLVSLTSGSPTVYFECNSISGNTTSTLFSTSVSSVLNVSISGSGIDTTAATIFSLAGNSKITATAHTVSSSKYLAASGTSTSLINSTIQNLSTANVTSGIDIVSIGTANFYVDHYTHDGKGLACAWIQNSQTEKIAFINTLWYSTATTNNHISLDSTQSSMTTKKIKLVGTNTFCGLTGATNSITSTKAVNINVQNSYAATAANSNVTFKVGMFTVDVDVNNFN